MKEETSEFTREELDRLKSLGWGQEMGFGDKPALIIVDFMKAFTTPDGAYGSNLDSCVEATAKVLELARQKGVLIVHIVTSYDEGCESSFGIWLRKAPRNMYLKAGSEDCEIDARVKPLTGEHIIRKQRPSAFFGTNLSHLLVSERIDTAIVTGCITSGCIRATVTDAMQYGFRPIVPRDCVDDREARAHHANLYDMQARYCDVVSAQKVVDYFNALPEKTRKETK